MEERLKTPPCHLGSSAAVAAPAHYRVAIITHKQSEQREQWKVETKAGGNDTIIFTPTDKRSLTTASETCPMEGKDPSTLVC